MNCIILYVSSHCRVESVEKVSPVEKRYEPLPQVSPSSQYGPPASTIPPNTLPKLSPNDGKFLSRLTLKSTHFIQLLIASVPLASFICNICCLGLQLRIILVINHCSFLFLAVRLV